MATIWDRGYPHQLCFNSSSGTLSADTTINVEVNGAVTTAVFVIPSGTAPGEPVTVDALKEVLIVPGDSVRLSSGGETGTAAADCALVMRR